MTLDTNILDCEMQTCPSSRCPPCKSVAVKVKAKLFQAHRIVSLQVADVPEELTWFQHAVENPPSLQHQSRLLVRKVLRKDLKHKVSTLPLPTRLKNYILLLDVLKVD